MSVQDPPGEQPMDDEAFWDDLLGSGDGDEAEAEAEAGSSSSSLKVLSLLNVKEKRKSYVKGDVVWVMRIVQANRNPHKVLRAVTEDDFRRSHQDFKVSSAI